MATISSREEEGDLNEGEAGEGEEGRPALGCTSFLFLFHFFPLSFLLSQGGEGLGDKGAPLGPATAGDRIRSCF